MATDLPYVLALEVSTFQIYEFSASMTLALLYAGQTARTGAACRAMSQLCDRRRKGATGTVTLHSCLGQGSSTHRGQQIPQLPSSAPRSVGHAGVRLSQRLLGKELVPPTPSLVHPNQVHGKDRGTAGR